LCKTRQEERRRCTVRQSSTVNNEIQSWEVSACSVAKCRAPLSSG